VTAPASPRLPLSRKLLYATIATLLGTLLVCGALEAGLRLAGFGYSPHFARRTHNATGARVWRENRWCTAPYFTPELVRRPQPFVVTVDKPARSYRVFVLGSSAAMGDPDASFSLARMLEKQLTAAYPDVKFDVVNAGITAINSHLVRGIAADCAQMRPDLFVVYEGNNEVIGPFGPAGVFSPFFRRGGIIRFAAWAQGTRTAQAFAALSHKLRRGAGAERDWGGMQMFLDQQIAADDPRLTEVVNHFRENLVAIAQTAKDAGATTLLCTVVTNQRDFAPFASRHRNGLSAADQKRWDEAVRLALEAERERDFAAAERQFRAALEIDDQYAEVAFRLGRLELQLGHDADARRRLQSALDLDTLRFRTDSRLNDAIRDAARVAPATQLVDLSSLLSAVSSHGMAGDDLLYEHVHLTFRGTYAAATQLLPAIAADLQRRGLVAAPPAHWLTLEEMRDRLAFTTYEQATIGVEMLKRFEAPPFIRQIDDAQRIAIWRRRMDAAEKLLQQPQATDALAAVYTAARQTAPDDWILARNAGEMLVARHRPADALPLLQQAAMTIPDDADTLAAIGLAHRALGHAADAAAFFAKTRELEPNHPWLPKDRTGDRR
jgi:tetratricopeptide (TPR) repeat protein